MWWVSKLIQTFFSLLLSIVFIFHCVFVLFCHYCWGYTFPLSLYTIPKLNNKSLKYLVRIKGSLTVVNTPFYCTPLYFCFVQNLFFLPSFLYFFFSLTALQLTIRMKVFFLKGFILRNCVWLQVDVGYGERVLWYCGGVV